MSNDDPRSTWRDTPWYRRTKEQRRARFTEAEAQRKGKYSEARAEQRERLDASRQERAEVRASRASRRDDPGYQIARSQRRLGTLLGLQIGMLLVPLLIGLAVLVVGVFLVSR